MMPSPPITRPAAECLKLNEAESRIFSLLKECCVAYQLPVTLRVAGGWVRDKLLGLECHDCDIAIDRMMGRNFAERLREYLLVREIPSSAFGVIQANPEKSKHLETATLTIFGYPIDFVNLRSESYTGNSRIPSVQFGTPLEDALRRDITINSLFYNLQSEMVEDFSGRGFEDLENRRVRTPLTPKETLLDDPLRLLRVVRFATRFQFSIDEELEKAIMDEQVDTAFRSKISRERVGTELDKILRDRHGMEGLQMLHRLKIFNLIFDIPFVLHSAYKQHLPSSGTTRTILHTLNTIWAMMPPILAYNKRLALLAASLLPFHGIMLPIRGQQQNKKSESLVLVIIRDSLKFANQDMADVSTLFASLDQVIALCKDDIKSASRTAIGRIVRTLGRHWQIGFHLACLRAILQGEFPETADTVRIFLEGTTHVEEIGLGEAWTIRALLSGTDIQEVLDLKEGRNIGTLLSALIDWQYEHPEGDKQDAVTFITTIASTLNNKPS